MKVNNSYYIMFEFKKLGQSITCDIENKIQPLDHSVVFF
jgi:hypothetical protein